MVTDTLTAPAPVVVDEAAAERAAVNAELVSLNADQKLFSAARDSVLATIARARVADLDPIEAELQGLAAREKVLRRRLALLRYLGLGPNDDRRAMAFQDLQQRALQARYACQNSHGGPHLGTVIAETWDRVMVPWQASGAAGVHGAPAVSAAQRNADFVDAFIDLAAELNRLAALSLEDKVRMGQRLSATR